MPVILVVARDDRKMFLLREHLAKACEPFPPQACPLLCQTLENIRDDSFRFDDIEFEHFKMFKSLLAVYFVKGPGENPNNVADAPNPYATHRDYLKRAAPLADAHCKMIHEKALDTFKDYIRN